MNMILKCRRTFVALMAIGCLTALGLRGTFDVSSAIAAVAIGLAGANAAERTMKNRATPSA